MKSAVSILIFFSSTIHAFSQEGVNEVIIISTNDVHGRIDNFSKMAAYVTGLKKTHKDVFVFNGGDLINGDPVVDEAKEKGYPVFDLMNSIPYDVSCLGNHEFENGETVLQQRLAQSSSVYVCANLTVNATSALKPLKPYTILHTTDGTSMAIIGLSANSSNPCVVGNVIMQSPVKKALEYNWLKDSSQVLIALTHIGYKADSILATEMKGLDLIVGGHSHTEIPHGIFINGTLITQAGDKLRFLGKTVLKIKDHHVIAKSFEMIDVARLIERDSSVQAKINAYNNNPLFSRTIGFSSTGFTNKEAMGCLKTDALRTVLKLDIAFDHVRNISYSSFPKGKITIGDIYEWDSYDYKTLRFDLTAAEIQQLIINSMKKADAPVLYVSGITYTVTKNAGDSITSVTLKNKNGLLPPTGRFSVGMNSFIACQFMKDIVATGTELPMTSAESLIAYFGKHKQVEYSHVQRVFVKSNYSPHEN